MEDGERRGVSPPVRSMKVEVATLRYRPQASHFLNNECTNGVSRVRL
jgi:hypothetical protein